MSNQGRDIVSVIKEQIEHFGISTTMVDVGTVVEVADGVARIYGLRGAKYNELLEFPHDIMGLALNLEEDTVGAVILGEYSHIKEGDEVRCTGKVAEVPVGSELIGRVITPLGVPIDGKGPIKTTKARPVERVAPNVVIRQPVTKPVHTGIKVVDAIVPIGRGQRELIIGDRSIGKSAIGIDTIISQKGKDLICIYVAIGQKSAKVAQIVETLTKYGAMEHTVVVAANASDPAAVQYLAPYAGCAIGEEFMEDGKDALVIYDDLTKHAWAYRQMSLILRRPPGREAYPGDVFYLHSRLLERAARLAPEYGGGSLTALPIIEVQAGDLSAYIPTNVISITDGQIYLESDLFNSGIRPAMNVGLSVSRVGGKAQTKAMRQVAGKLRIDMAQYSELAAFAQFGTSDLDKATQLQLARGQRIQEILKQPQYAPMSLAQEVTILYAVTNGYLDDIPVDKIMQAEQSFHRYMETSHPEILKSIESDTDIKEKTEEALKEAIKQFKQNAVF
ncbi:MAG TPA: F0F1 ATP synthase subunit alpha [Dehalococcoidia bacterium]|nr:F0F1 ATP synthase subunit alpha [Dehalococcoidia bacterium]